MAAAAPDTITITSPDDLHLHVRDGAITESVIFATARQFRRAIIMPNVTPPVVNTKLAIEYRERVMAALDKASKNASKADVEYARQFQPLMTLYLTDSTDPAEIKIAKDSGMVFACKLYPAGATTNSDNGVTDVKKIYPVLRAMEEHDLPLLVHGEVTDSCVDLFDREAVFVETILKPLVEEMPKLRVVMEHITTKEGTEFVMSQGDNICATVTAHHLLYNRNVIFKGGVSPHYYCLPVIKGEEHRQALLAAVTGPKAYKFFAGTDSAPHTKETKECACGKAGCYTAFHALELYAETFDKLGRMDLFQAFCSENGARFYKLPKNEGTVTLTRKKWTVPSFLPLADTTVIPIRAGEDMEWAIQRD